MSAAAAAAGTDSEQKASRGLKRETDASRDGPNAKKWKRSQVWVVLVEDHVDCYKRASTSTYIKAVFDIKKKALHRAVEKWINIFRETDGDVTEKNMTKEEKTLRAHPRMVQIFGDADEDEADDAPKTIMDVINQMTEDELQTVHDLMCAWHASLTGEFTDSPSGESVSIELHDVE